MEGPADASESALPYIMQVLRDNMGELEDFLKSVDDEVFKDPSVSVDEYWGEPYVPTQAMDEEENVPWPWWVWLAIGAGILVLLCCLCLCCRYYSMYRDVIKEKEIREDERSKVMPMVVEKPVIVDRPVIMDSPVKEKKSKKSHKKKKKKKRKTRRVLRIEQQQPQVLHIEQPPQVLQIDQPQPQILRVEQPHEGPEIAVFDRYPEDMTARSGITFDYDPPSEEYSYYEEEEPYHGRLLAPPSVASSASTPLALPAPPMEEQSMRSMHDDPSAYYSNYSRCSTLDPSQGGGDDLDMMYDEDGNRSGYFPQQHQPSGTGWDELASGRLPYYAKEPSGHQPDELASYATQSLSSRHGGTVASSRHGGTVSSSRRGGTVSSSRRLGAASSYASRSGHQPDDVVSFATDSSSSTIASRSIASRSNISYATQTWGETASYETNPPARETVGSSVIPPINAGGERRQRAASMLPRMSEKRRSSLDQLLPQEEVRDGPGGDNMFAGFDDPSFASVDHKDERKLMRRLDSVGVESLDDDMYLEYQKGQSY